jgi:hypothetical protein
MSTQCAYVNKVTGIRCENDSSYGCRTCWQHGARNNIVSGKDHVNFVHGNRSLQYQKECSEQLLKLRYLEDAGRLMGLIVGNKTPGRKPKGYIKLELRELLTKLT